MLSSCVKVFITDLMCLIRKISPSHPSNSRNKCSGSWKMQRNTKVNLFKFELWLLSFIKIYFEFQFNWSRLFLTSAYFICLINLDSNSTCDFFDTWCEFVWWQFLYFFLFCFTICKCFSILLLIFVNSFADEYSEMSRSLAALTGIDRTEWANLRIKYFASGINKESLDVLESAIFHVYIIIITILFFMYISSSSPFFLKTSFSSELS